MATDGCGLSSLSMGIASMLGNFLDPTDLFREANDAGYYYGAGFGHDALIFLGNNHGVSVDWTDDIDAVYSALEAGKGVIFHVGPEIYIVLLMGDIISICMGLKRKIK